LGAANQHVVCGVWVQEGAAIAGSPKVVDCYARGTTIPMFPTAAASCERVILAIIVTRASGRDGERSPAVCRPARRRSWRLLGGERETE
jgi:hypothetical protein